MVRCTECGQEFNPGDTSTTLDAPIPPWRRSPILKHGVRVAIVLLVIVGFKITAFPRPADWDDWRLWLWFGRPIGVMHMRTSGFSTRAVGWQGGPINLPPFRLPDHDVYAHVWFGEETLVEAYRVDDQTLAWRVEDLGGNRYRLQALEAGIRSEMLLSAFNSIKGSERFFGVQVGRPERRVSAEPFTVEGDEVAVFSALVREFGFQLTPFRLSESQRYVWTWNPTLRRMIPADLTPETENEYTLDDRDTSRVLIPKPH